MAIAPLIVGIRTRGVASLAAAGLAFRRLGANIRVASNQWANSFIARGGLMGSLGRQSNRLGSVFARAGATAGRFFMDNFRTIAITGAAAAAAPIAATLVAGLLAALGAGVLLAAGGGIFAAGIKAAADAPPVKAAFKSFSERTKKAFKDFGGPFQAPMVKAADTFASTLERMAPSFNKMSAMAAPWIDKLAPAFAQLAENALPGFQKAFEASLPLFGKLAEHAPKIGTAISKFFEKVADAGPEIVRVFDAILTAIEWLIEALGTLINWGAKFYSTMIDFWVGVKDFAVEAFATITRTLLTWAGNMLEGAAKAFGWIPGIGDKLEQAQKDFEEFARKANAALDGIDDEDVIVNVKLNDPGNTARLVDGRSRIKMRARGGPVTRGMPYIVGENRPELFIPNQSGYIMPRVSGAAAASAGGRTVIEIRSGGSQFDDALVALLSRAVRARGGNVQTVLGGRRG